MFGINVFISKKCISFGVEVGNKAKSDLITSCDSAAHWVIINVRSTQFNFKEKLCNLFMFNHRKVPELFWLLVCR